MERVFGDGLTRRYAVVRERVLQCGQHLLAMSPLERFYACRTSGKVMEVFRGKTEAASLWNVDRDGVATRDIDFGDGVMPHRLFGFDVGGVVYVADAPALR